MRTRTMVLLGLAAAAAAAVVAPAAAGEHLRRAGGEVGERAGGRVWEGGEEEGEARGERAAAGGARAVPAVDPKYAKECGACHLAYPPSLLPAASWRKVMSGLDRHFGQNAELDETTRAKLERWLVDNADNASGSEPAAPLRISDAGWFRREHREVAHRVGKGKQAASFADCAACHAAAVRWDFGEDRATIGRE